MAAYILRRILLMIPTLFGIMLLSFIIIQFAPGGPVEQAIARISGQGGSVMATVTGANGDLVPSGRSGLREMAPPCESPVPVRRPP